MVKLNSYKVLLVDDEEDILEFLSYNLKQHNFQVFTADSGEEALKIAQEIIPHIILLDIMMPGIDGIETCEKLRAMQIMDNTIIAFLTARGEDYSQIAGFEAGGDDYISKPVRAKVLISKIKAMLKRFEKNDSIAIDTVEKDRIIHAGNIIIDQDRYIVTINSKETEFPKKEFELLLLLISKPDKVFTREQIFSSVWGHDVIVSDRTIDVHIRKLREKIGDERIKTIKGVGYKFVD